MKEDLLHIILLQQNNNSPIFLTMDISYFLQSTGQVPVPVLVKSKGKGEFGLWAATKILWALVSQVQVDSKRTG